MKGILELSDEEVLAEAHKLRVAYGLKRTLRYSTKRNFSEHSESVAEHIFGLMYLAQYFIRFEDPDRRLNFEKIREILLFHDFGEIKHGDIPYPMKTDADEELERQAAVEIFNSLPQPFGDEAMSAWQEFDERKTKEAHFAYAIDKMEPLFELLDPVNETTPKRLTQNYDSHMGVKMRATEKFPVMRRFLEVISEDMRRRGIFMEN